MAQEKTPSPPVSSIDTAHKAVSNDINISLSGKGGSVQLVIYDFDQTITKSHLYRELHGRQLEALSKITDDELISMFGGPKRINLLHKHFKFLKEKYIEVGILSFGWTEVIKQALKRLQFDVYFNLRLIFGRDSQELVSVIRNKGKVIQNIMQQKHLKYDQVLFVDDQVRNIENTKQFCKTLHVEERCGITEHDMSCIEKQIRLYSEEEIKQIVSDQKTEKENATKSENHKPTMHAKKPSKLDKYKIKSVPKWFEELDKKPEDSPVIEIKDETFAEIIADNKQEIKIATKFTFGNINDYE